MENTSQNKSYLAFYEQINFEWSGRRPYSMGIPCWDRLEDIGLFSAKALETGMVTLEESKKFDNSCQVAALKSGKATVEEALKINDAFKFLALESERTTAEEAAMFSNSVQIAALRKIENISVADALKLNYCFQIDLVKSKKFTVDQVARLNNTFPEKLAVVMNIEGEKSINYIENIAPTLNKKYYSSSEKEKCDVFSISFASASLEEFYEPDIIILNHHNCNLNLFIENFCKPRVQSLFSGAAKLIHIAEITENNQLIPLNISDILGLYDGFEITRNINLLTEVYYSLFPADQVV